MAIEQRNNKPSIASDTSQPNNGQLAAYKNLKNIKAKHEADGTTDSAEYKTNQGNLERLEARFPSLTEPNIDKTVHDNIESNKGSGKKGSGTKSSSTSDDTDKDDEQSSDVSAPSPQQQQVNEDTSATKDKLAELKAKYGAKGNTETSNSTEPNTKTDSSPLDKYRGENKVNTETPNSSEQTDTGDHNIT